MSDYAVTLAYPSQKPFPGVLTEIEVNKPAGTGWRLITAEYTEGAVLTTWDKSAVSTGRAQVWEGHFTPVANATSAKAYFIPPIPVGSDDTVDVAAIKVVTTTKSTSAAGTFLLQVRKNGATQMLTADYSLEALTDDTVADMTLTATTADLSLADGDYITIAGVSNNADLSVGTEIKVFVIFEVND